MGLRFLALACLVGAAFAGPVQRQSESRCSTQCHPSPRPKLNFEPGKAYVYHYRSQNNITFQGETKESSTIECRAELHFETRCEGHLICKDVRIHQKISQEERDDLRKQLEIALKFSYNDGKLEHVCPSSEESQQSLNVKKGILSTFVNKMANLEKSEKVEEKDGNGKCLTTYTVQNKVIKKVKDLRKCTETPHTKTSFLKTKLPSHLHPKEDHLECNQYVEDRIMQKIHCVENQKLINILKDSETLKFTALIHVNLLEIKPAERKSWQEPINREEITYSIDEPRQGDRNVKHVERVLKNMCSKNEKVIDIAVGKDFMALVYLFKSLRYDQLSETYQKLKDGPLCSSKKVRNIFGDALAVAATDDCIKLMVEMMVNDDVSIVQRTLWPVALTLRSHITEETVAAMRPLLEKDQSSSTLIPIAKMIRTLCSEKDCGQIQAVEEIIRILARSLGSRCSAEDDKQIKAVLIAFGNMGHHGSAHGQIMECVKSRSLSTELRLLAIRSFRQMNHKRPRDFVQIINDKREPHELRIEAFQSVLTQADERQVRELKVIAEKESNTQVSSYMDTCIRNMNNTRSPKHQEIKKLLQDIEIHPKTGDYWTHSKNIEFSTYNNASGLGLTTETDIIHGVKTKLPISFHTKLGGVLHGKEKSLTEFGIRTEGFEDILLNMMAMKDKMPKLEELRLRLEKNPSLEEVKEEIKGLLKEVFGDNRPEISMYFRLLGIQYMTLSTSDLSSGLEEMLKIAQLLNKLAHGKDADFSHSFVFMNAKLVIPSITGRSYSIDLAGSSTVGLTAKAKADILNLPQKADIHFHVQPSVNVEISTKVGIESASHRPSMKHVSRVHFESDVEFKVEVRDGRLAIARMTLPSENIAMARLSTDVVEVDQDHNEKSIFQKMQKKIDYTFEHLSKPLGIIATAQVEVPKPFVIRSFPFIMPFGKGEIALKTSDVKSYELRFEIPKQVSPSMKLKASFDTPGSKVSRRFEAVAELKRQRDQKDLLLELITPFETVGAKCLLTHNDDHTGGSLELYTSKKQLASANITHKFASSRSRNIYEISGAYSILRQDPSRIDGRITVIKGRKTHVSFDFKTNKPQSKPLSLKGTIMKEGRFGLSQMSEWKISSEVSLQSPAIDVNLRKTVEKRSKQLQAISANIGIDYQLRGQQQHSFTLSGTSQKSSNKFNTIAKLESTQYPRANMHLTWDMQREEGMKNEIKVKCGQNLDQTCIHLKQKSHFPQTGLGSCSTSLDIPHRDIHYELNIDHEVDMKSEKPKFHIGLDLCYHQDKHIKGVLDVKCESMSPLKASGRAELESPFAHYIYEDGIEETSDNVFEGKAKLQKIKGRDIQVSQIQYKYRKSSRDSKVHHEIETSILTPLSRSPINSKASIELSSESLDIAGHFGPEHSVEAQLKETGVSHIIINFPMIEGTVDLTTKGAKKTVNADLKTKSQRIIASAMADLGDRKKFEIRVQPDFDRSPEKRIVASIGGEKKYGDSKYIYTGVSMLEFLDKLNVSLVEKGGASIFEDHESILKISTQNREPVIIKLKNKIVDGRVKTTIVVSKRNVEKINFELDAGLKQTSHKKEVSVEMSLSSQDHSIEDTHMYFKNQVTKSGSSKNIQTAISFKKNDKVYKTEWNSDLQPNGLEVKAQMQTPHVNYEKIAGGLSLQVSDSSLTSSANIVYSDNRKISIQTEIEAKRHRLSLTSKISSESETIGVVQVTIDSHRHKKTLEAYLDTKNDRVCEIQGSIRRSSQETKLEGSVKLAELPEIKFRGFNISIHSARSSALLSANVLLINNEKISWISEIKEQDDSISATTSIDTRRKNIKAHLSIKNQEAHRSLLSYVDVDGHRKGDVEISITSSSQNLELKARSKTVRTPEISAHLKYEKTGETFLVTAIVMKGTSPLLSTSFNRLSNQGEEKLLMKTKTFEDTLLDLEISKQVSGRNLNQYSLKAKGPFPEVHITFSKNSNDKHSISTELRACRREQSEVCYTLKSLHKHLNYRLDLEKSVGGSYSHTVGRLHMLVTGEVSKIILERNEKKYGYELKVHRRQHENDRCSFDWYFYKASGTSRVRASILHNERHINLEALIIPDVDHPTRKLSLEMKKEINPDNQEISGFLKMSHPRMSQPLLITGKLRPVGQLHSTHTPRLYSGRFVMHSGPVWGKTLILEALPNIEQESYGIRSMEYKLYTDDKSIDAYLKLSLQRSKSEKKIGYEWKYVSHDEEKKGGLTLTLSNRNGGKTIKVSFSSPSVNYEVQGSAETPNAISLSLATSGRKLKEINIKIQDSCAVLEFRKSGKPGNPEFKSHICVNKREGKALQLLKVNVQYRHHECVDIRVAINPEKPSIVDVVLKCNKDESCRALREKVRELLSELQQEIKQVVRQSKKDVVEPLRNYLQHLYHSLSSKLENVRKDYSRKSEEIKQYLLRLLHSSLPAPVIEAYERHYQNIHREAIRLYKKAKEIGGRYWPLSCGLSCESLKSALKYLSIKEARLLIVRKVDEAQKLLRLALQKFRMIYPSDVINFVKNAIKGVKDFVEKKIISTFGVIIGKTIIHQLRKIADKIEVYIIQYANRLETKIRQTVIDTVDEVIKKIHHLISHDEDLQTAQNLILNAKDEVVKAWRNKEELISKLNAKRVETCVKENLKKVVDSQVEVLKYDSKEGEYRFRFINLDFLMDKLRQILSRFRR